MATGMRDRCRPPAGLLEEKRGPATAALHAAIGDLGDFEPDGHRFPNAHELADLLDRFDKSGKLLRAIWVPCRTAASS
jgi:hypothetical protein